MSSYNSRLGHLETVECELALDIQRRHSFFAPGECTPGNFNRVNGDDQGSTSSECTSAFSSIRPISTTISSTGDQSMFQITSPSQLYDQTYVQQLPQHFVQPAERQVYPSVVYKQQHHHGYDFTPSPYGIPPLGYAPVAVLPTQMNMSMRLPIRQHQVVYPVQERHPVPKNMSQVPLSNSAIPYIVNPVAFPQANREYWQGASAVSSAVSTPVVSCFSSPGYASNGNINTPVLSSASCKPIQSSSRYPEVPPALVLAKCNTKSYGYPQRYSCNINTGTVSSDRETPVSVDTPSANKERNKPATLGIAYPQRETEKLKKTVASRKEVNLWTGSLNYEENQLNGGSNLFITWSRAKDELVDKLQSFKLQVREVLSTSDKNICNVIFESHPIARKAFTMQQQIRVRSVPPKNSHRIWFRNPSPTFLVKFETNCRLSLRKGKADCHDVIGELRKGCLITCDQLKGNRMRVIYCEGMFVFPSGNTFEMKGVQSNSGKKTSFGWISYRSKYTNESLVTRRSWNKLEDYVYNK